MKLNGLLFIFTLLVFTGCTPVEENLTQGEILERTLENMGEFEIYSFELTSEQIDGLGYEMFRKLESETEVTPFRASIDQYLELDNDSIELKTYYLEDMIYYGDFTAPDYLFKTEADEQPDHLLDGLEALHSRTDDLQFAEEENAYVYEYSEEQEADHSFFDSLYPFFVITDPLETVISDLYVEHSDIVDLDVVLRVDREHFFVQEMLVEYVLNVDYFDSGDPSTLSETIVMSFSDYNEVEDVHIPVDEIQEAVTFQEHLEIIAEEREAERREHVPEVIEEDLGNVGANLMNGGLWAADDEWMYFSLRGEGLQKAKLDGSEKQQLLENEVSDLNVVDDWIYYIDETRDYQAYKMKTDGSEEKQITATYTTDLVVVDDWIYFRPTIDSLTGEVPVSRLQTDLTHHEHLLDDLLHFTVGQGYVFFQNEFPGPIYYLDANDIDAEPVMYGHIYAKHFAVSDGWLYYENADDEDRLYRFSLDNGQIEALTEHGSEGFNVMDSYVFYRNVEDQRSLYRYNVETDEEDKLSEEVYQIYVIDADVYYAKAETRYQLDWYRMNSDGTQKEKVDF